MSASRLQSAAPWVAIALTVLAGAFLFVQRIAVLETQVAGLQQTTSRVEAKVDRLVERTSPTRPAVLATHQ